jgi:hypothetical protein
MNLTKLESYLRVNLLGPGPSSYKKIIYRAAANQRLENIALGQRFSNCGPRVLPLWSSGSALVVLSD